MAFAPGFLRTGRIRAALLCCGLALCSGAIALPEDAPGRFERLSVEQGLRQTSITSLLQDRRGFVWIGTQSNLFRYDGYSFVSYERERGRADTLADNWIWCLHEDANGLIWIGTNGGGLNRLDPVSGTVKSYRVEDGEGHGPPGNEILAIAGEPGVLWLTTREGLTRFDIAREEFRNFRPSGATATLGALLRNADGTLLLGADHGLQRFDPQREAFTADPAGPQAAISALLRDRAGTLWIGTTTGLYRQAAAGGEAQRVAVDGSDNALSDASITTLLEDGDGTIWAGTYQGGLNRIDVSSGRIQHLRHDPLDPQSLSDDRVSALLADRSGTLWAGTWNKGLNLLDLGGPGFVTWRNRPGTGGGLSEDKIYAVDGDGGDVLWLATLGGGLDRLDTASGAVRVYRHDATDARSLSDDVVRATLVDGTGVVWAGTRNGLDRLDADGNGFTHYRNDPADAQTLSDNAIRTLFEDRAGRLWIGTEFGGLNLLDRATGRVTRWRHDPADPASLGADYVRVIYEDRAGRLWVGPFGAGLQQFDPATGRFTRQRGSNDAESLANDRVSCLFEDSGGTMWVCTGDGLARATGATDDGQLRFRTYTTGDGLASNVIGAIEEDSSGALWISTVVGLSRYDAASGRFRNYSLRDGTLNGGYYIHSSAAASDRRTIFFGGAEGLTAFQPERVHDNTIPPQVQITELLLFNRPAQPRALQPGSPLERAIFATDLLTLDHRQQVVSFEFAALHFADTRRNRFTYMLEGFDHEWRETDAQRRFATYTNLPAGQYRFRVRAANRDGVWNEEGAAVEVRVLPAPWRTTTAYLLYALSLALVLGRWLHTRRQKMQAADRYHEAIRASEERLKLALWGSGDAMWNLELRSQLLHIDGMSFLGYEDDELPPTVDAYRALVHADDRERVRTTLGAHLRGQTPHYECEYRVRAKGGEWVWILDRGKIVERDKKSGEVTRFAGTFRDNQGRKRAEEALVQLAKFDPLTGLPNRAMFQERLGAALAQAARHEQRIALLFIDLDRFKQVNDSLGHQVGDALLQEVARRFRDVLREGDLVARLGGDEFTVILEEIRNENEVALIAGKLIGLFAEPLDIGGRELAITPSIGISMFPEDGKDTETLLQHADTAMYHAKENGRNTYQFYTASMNQSVVRRMLLENGLRRAIERGELRLAYQPRMTIADGAFAGAEVLARWTSTEHGEIPPNDFIPLAEETGLILPVGAWVLEQACSQYMQWQRAGCAPFRLSVNLSARQLIAGELVPTIARALLDTGMPADALELELTETGLMTNAEVAIRGLDELKAMGLRIAVDDFGTGYSSLGYLKRFPIDTLKIDRSFIRDVCENSEDATIVSAIIAMAHALRHVVVAEGVEHPAQLALLRAHGCDEVQGYLYSRPLDPGAFAAFMQQAGAMPESRASALPR